MFLISSDEVIKPIENDSSVISQNGYHQKLSPKSNKKGVAPKPPRVTSVKTRQAPTINELHSFNGTDGIQQT